MPPGLEAMSHSSIFGGRAGPACMVSLVGGGLREAQHIEAMGRGLSRGLATNRQPTGNQQVVSLQTTAQTQISQMVQIVKLQLGFIVSNCTHPSLRTNCSKSCTKHKSVAHSSICYKFKSALRIHCLAIAFVFKAHAAVPRPPMAPLRWQHLGPSLAAVPLQKGRKRSSSRVW